MGVEGCTKCIKYLLFVFNFVFWVSSHGDGEHPHGSQAGQRARPSREGAAQPRSCGATCGLRAPIGVLAPLASGVGAKS